MGTYHQWNFMEENTEVSLSMFTYNTICSVTQHTSSASSATMARIAFKTRFEPENTKPE
jgi:hypothetical protein